MFGSKFNSCDLSSAASTFSTMIVCRAFLLCALFGLMHTRTSLAGETPPPTETPSLAPISDPTIKPTTLVPTIEPSTFKPSTSKPSFEPSFLPSTITPTVEPSTHKPTVDPTTFKPSAEPTTLKPTAEPTTSEPSFKPTTSSPTVEPTTSKPTVQPSFTPAPSTAYPTTAEPSIMPSPAPSTSKPSSLPSSTPTGSPSSHPTRRPRAEPTSQPSSSPTSHPTHRPRSHPTSQPSGSPTGQPSSSPTRQPIARPTGQPSGYPTGQPAALPTSQPSGSPTSQPSGQPVLNPTARPTGQPSGCPSGRPSSQPSVQPSEMPSTQPTSQPSRQPVERPSSGPTSQPSVQPSSQPSLQPFAAPSSLPTAQPSTQPTSQPIESPTSFPSAQPTVQPSSQPSDQPTNNPTGTPLSKPTSQPTSQPSAAPSSEPTAQPSAEPSTQPTSVPSSFPTGQPSTQPSGWPTSVPTGQPSAQPTSAPSGEPTGQPSSLPSNQPSSQPSAQPSSQPTEYPTGVPVPSPTSKPSRQPTSQPSTQPSGQPIGRPTSLPTGQPSVAPSGQPSSQPTGQPSSQPSGQPSMTPSGQPSTQPTSRPSTQPSTQPTGEPSAQPSMQPSRVPSGQPTTVPSAQPQSAPTSQPTSQPTREANTRYYLCNSDTVCEQRTDTSCVFFTPSVVLECVSSDVQCYIGTNSFLVGQNTTLTVRGGCEFVVNATSTITIEGNATVQAAAVQLTAQSNIFISGKVSTSGRGTTSGPGAPSGSELGRGGTYGGSGGMFACEQDYFYSCFTKQIGSIDVFSDLLPTSPNYLATFGSGGGAANAGRGGGRIVIESGTNVHIYPSGTLDASGTAANTTAFRPLEEVHFDSRVDVNGTVLGSGSGGSIAISGLAVSQQGFVTVAGGPAVVVHGRGAGAAGGGGRITIKISSGTIKAILTSNIAYHGGDASLSNSTCLAGGAGTLFVQYHSTTTANLVNSVVAISNSYVPTFAVTFLQVLPALTTGIAARAGAVVASNGTIELPSLSKCNYRLVYTTYCSEIIFEDAFLVTLSDDRNISASEVKPTFVSSIVADLIDLSGSHISGIRLSPYSFNIAAGTITMSQNSSATYTDHFKVVARFSAHLYGDVIQAPIGADAQTDVLTYQAQSLFHAVAAYNVSLGNVAASNMLVNANSVVMEPGAVLSKLDDVSIPSCYLNITEEEFGCNKFRYHGLRSTNNTYVFVGNHSVQMHGASLAASQVLMCAPNVFIHANSTVDANYRGCLANSGYGAGGAQSPVDNGNPNGGGGGGYGGAGGAGYNAVNGGLGHFYKYALSSGSGGGCLNCNLNQSVGGGLINIVANRTMLDGNLSAVGSDAANGAGGGSGGSVAINSIAMSGGGHISASGGDGGSGLYPGGGGGGGVVSLFNSVGSYQDYSFFGFVNVDGGSAGVVLSSSNAHTSQSEYPYSPADGIYAGPSAPSVAPNLRKSLFDGPSPAQDGATGQKFLPVCKKGTGNQVTGAICETCPVGTYSLGESTGPCTQCTNAPKHSSYTQTGTETPDCLYECDPSYVTEHCYNQIQNFIYTKMGIPAFASMCVGVFLLLMLPLTYTRLKRRYGWFTYLDKKTKKRRDVFGFDFFSHDDDDTFMFESQHSKGESTVIKMQTFTTENPVFKSSADDDGNRDSTDSTAGTRIRALRNKMFAERRREHRMNDQDLVFHAYRVNLFGTNHPFQSRGGQWRFPTVRPACLRPMLRRKEFAQLAEKINNAMGWKIFGLELLTYALVGLVTPPFAAHMMKIFRKRRGNALLKIIANYDYECFRCPKQRQAQNSLRIGISPDFTLAYVDFLFDEDHFKTRSKPLCPVGQVKLPASFKIAGLGTYFSPYLIDTNDLLLQAVPQTDIPSSFINDAWIRFVVELNAILRTVQADSMHLGVYKLVNFLSEEQHTVNLGGLVVEFCTFPNSEKVYQSEIDRAAKEEAEQLRLADTDPAAPISITSGSPPTGSGRKKPDTQAEVDRFSLDSFGAATGHRKSEDGGWFANFLDAGAGWTLPGTGGSKKHDNKPQEIEMRSSSFKAPSAKEMGSSIISRESRDSSAKLVNNAPSSGWCGCTLQAVPGLLYTYTSIVNAYNYIRDTIAHFLASGYKSDDPAGKFLTYHEMCNAIQEGNLTMGIIVTHPKVVTHSYVVQDEDYESEDEDFYTEDVTPPKRLGMHREGMSDESDSEKSDPEATDGTESETESSRVASSATDVSVNMSKVYGDKADEMQKFYNIMLSAEAAMTPVSSPVAEADRKRLPHAGRVLPRLGRDSPVPPPSDSPEVTSKRAQSARHPIKINTVPQAPRETARPRSEQLKASPKAASKASEMSKSSDAEETKVSSSEGVVVDAVAGAAEEEEVKADEPEPVAEDSENQAFQRSRSGSEASYEQTERKSEEKDTQEREVRFSSFGRKSDASNASNNDSGAESAEPASKQRTRSVSSDAHHQTVLVRESNRDFEEGLSAQPDLSLPAPFRHSTGTDGSGSEVDDMPKPSRRSADSRESLPTVVAANSDREEENKEEDIPPSPALKHVISMNLTGFRRSEYGTEEADEAPVIDRAMSMSHDSGGNSPRSANKSRADKEEYTEFRPLDRTRRLTTSVEVDAEDRFSDFRHSHAFDDRPSDFEHRDTGGGSFAASMGGARYSEYEENDAYDADNNNNFNDARPSRMEPSLSMRPSQLERGNSNRSVRSKRYGSVPDISSVLPKRLRPLSKNKSHKVKQRKVQKDLSGVNLAPSAYQQEHSSWRLVQNSTVPVSEAELMHRPRSSQFEYGISTHGGAPRQSMMVDRSSMITADNRNVEMEEGAGGMQMNPLTPRRQHSDNNLSSWAQNLNRGSELEMESSSKKNRVVSAKLTIQYLQSEGRQSETQTVHTEHLGPAVTAPVPIEERFMAIYYIRRVYLFIVRFFFGGNVMPVGPPTVLRVLEIILLGLSLADIALGAMICFEYYCASDDSTTCQDHNSMLQILFFWPLALIVTPIMGVTAIMLGPHANLTRMYASWSRLAGINNIMMAVVFFRYLSFFVHLPISFYPPIIYTCSRVLQCLIVDQYIAHIEKLRYTRGWDGLSTSLFMTQDSKAFINT